MLKIYANSMSHPCIKCRYACNVLGIEYEWVGLDFTKGEHKTPEHMARHPAGKMPAIDDDGFLLFESDAICRYLNAKHGGSLVPDGLEAIAIMDQWNAFAIQHVALAMSKVAFNRVFAPKFNMPVDENSLKEGVQWLARYLPVVDERLGSSEFYGGDALSLADITLLALLDMAEIAEIGLDAYANISAWRSRLQAESWCQDAHADNAAPA
ncbi:MAG: glutathione S-transferase family protein [Verrucomicrobia bacterium]|nr:glutathione S-transferase family protein [Verrucomicrobiota bacterium]MDA1087344.1 glutathione S-transferase family protein [Verrucomicrobiota bacterium]